MSAKLCAAATARLISQAPTAREVNGVSSMAHPVASCTAMAPSPHEVVDHDCAQAAVALLAAGDLRLIAAFDVGGAVRWLDEVVQHARRRTDRPHEKGDLCGVAGQVALRIERNSDPKTHVCWKQRKASWAPLIPVRGRPDELNAAAISMSVGPTRTSRRRGDNAEPGRGVPDRSTRHGSTQLRYLRRRRRGDQAVHERLTGESWTLCSRAMAAIAGACSCRFVVS